LGIQLMTNDIAADLFPTTKGRARAGVPAFDPDGAFKVTRSDIFGGKIVPFVPLTGGHQRV
jgi:hypothetical protein